MHGLWQDLRYAARSLAKQPGHTAVAALTMALGVGATVAIFSVFHSVLVDPLPYPESDRLVRLYGSLPEKGADQTGVSPANFLDFRERLDAFSDLAAYSYFGLSLNEDGRPREITTLRVSPEFFAVLGTPAALGRTFRRQDDPQARLVVLSHGLWQRELGSDPAIVGETLRLDEEPWTVLGVMVGVVADARHEGLETAPAPEVFFPFAQSTTGTMSVVVRTAGDPAGLIEAVQQKVWQVDPAQPVFRTFTLAESVAEALARRRFYTFLVGLFAAVALALACVGTYGVISYSVARRRREIGVRMALGAKVGTILGMVVGEGVRLLAVGLAAGLGLALFATRLAESLLFEVSATDPPTLLWASLALAAVALGACAMPARRAAAVAPSEALREG